MATPQNQRMSAQDQIMQLKQFEKDSKMKEKELKRQEKMRKREEKRRKKLEKRRKKLAKKGIILPDQERKPAPTGPESVYTAPGTAGTRTLPAPEETMTEAEVISAEADVWTPKSARDIDEIEKRVDRMDKERIHSLKERYKARYGEDMEIPDAYNVESTIDVETAERTGEIESIEKTDQGTDEPLQQAKSEKKGLGFSAFGKKDKKKDKKKSKIKVDRPVRFLDLRKPLFLVSKFTIKESGIGKKVILGLLDIIILLISIIIFPILIIRIIGTIIYIRRDKLDLELFESMADDGSQPQPAT